MWLSNCSRAEASWPAYSYSPLSQIDFDDPANRKYNWDQIVVDLTHASSEYTPFHIEMRWEACRIVCEPIPFKIYGTREEQKHHREEIRALYHHFGLDPPHRDYL